MNGARGRRPGTDLASEVLSRGQRDGDAGALRSEDMTSETMEFGEGALGKVPCPRCLGTKLYHPEDGVGFGRTCAPCQSRGHVEASEQARQELERRKGSTPTTEACGCGRVHHETWP